MNVADPKFYGAGNIDLILGSSVIGKILRGGLIQRADLNFTAQNTDIRWELGIMTLLQYVSQRHFRRIQMI